MARTAPDTAMADALMAAVALMAQKNPDLVRKGKGREKSTPEVKAARQAANDAECIKVFTAAGFKDVQPRVNVLTYGKVKPDGTVTGWLSKGRKVRAGEKSLQVGPFRLFHIDQTDEIPVGPVEVEGEQAVA